MFEFLLVVQAIVTLALIGVILMQKSEGGGLGVGGSPAGFLSARGAADFLTRATAVLATLFVALSIALAVFVSIDHRAARVDVEAARDAQRPAAPAGPEAPATPLTGGAPTGAPAAPLTGGAPGTPLANPLGSPLPGAAPATGQNQPAPEGLPLQQ
jgi:preprotein translocase subunit SecG